MKVNITKLSKYSSIVLLGALFSGCNGGSSSSSTPASTPSTVLSYGQNMGISKQSSDGTFHTVYKSGTTSTIKASTSVTVNTDTLKHSNHTLFGQHVADTTQHIVAEVGANGTALVSLDGGNKFTSVYTGTTQNLNAVVACGSMIFAAGNAGTLEFYDLSKDTPVFASVGGLSQEINLTSLTCAKNQSNNQLSNDQLYIGGYNTVYAGGVGYSLDTANIGVSQPSQIVTSQSAITAATSSSSDVLFGTNSGQVISFSVESPTSQITTTAFSGNKSILGLAYNSTSDTYIAVGQQGSVAYVASSGNSVWESGCNNLSNNLDLTGVTNLLNGFAISGVSGTLITTQNLTNCTTNSTNTTQDLNTVTVSQNSNSQTYVSVAGANGTVVNANLDSESNLESPTFAQSGAIVSTIATNGASSVGIAFGLAGQSFVLTANNSNLESWSVESSNVNLNSITFGGNIFVGVSTRGGFYISQSGNAWTLESQIESTVSLNSITYGQVTVTESNYFAAVGSNGAVYKSTDGINWTLSTQIANVTLKSITYGNNEFIIVGSNGAIYYSSDLVNWNNTSTVGLLIPNYTAVTYSSTCNMFYAVSSNGTITQSSNGINWGIPLLTNPYLLENYTGVGTSSDGTIYIATSEEVFSNSCSNPNLSLGWSQVNSSDLNQVSAGGLAVITLQ